MRNHKISEMTIYAMFIAILAILSFTPLGYFSIGGVSVTLVHLIVLIAAFVLGIKGGLIVGLVFGIFSMLRAWVAPNALADYIFRNPLVSVLPRLAFGAIAGGFAELLRHVKAKNALYVSAISALLVVVCLAVVYFTMGHDTWIVKYFLPIAGILLLGGAIALVVMARKTEGKTAEQAAIGGLSGIATFAHTAMVLPLLYVVGSRMADTKSIFENMTFGALFGGTLAANGVIEIVLAVIITPLVCLAINRVYHRPDKQAKSEVPTNSK